MSESIRDTIVPKSDQLNADDLLTGPQVFEVKGWKRGSADQPVCVNIGLSGRPYKPCKSMRRVLTAAWGEFPDAWVGQFIKLYRNPNVEWGGEPVGGIEISNMTGLVEPLKIMLTRSRGKRKPFIVQPLIIEGCPPLKKLTNQERVELIITSLESRGIDEPMKWIGDALKRNAEDVPPADKWTDSDFNNCRNKFTDWNKAERWPK